MSIVAIIVASFTAAAQAPISVDNQKQLFLDDYAIATMDNVDRTVEPATPFTGNPVLWPEEPWEGNVALLYGSVIQDGDRYRMWYHNGTGVGYAESTDGISWTKPRLGLVTVDGQDTNGVIARESDSGNDATIPSFYELFGVFKDPGAEDPGRRYVMGYLSVQRGYEGPREDPFHRTQRRGLGVAFSADGIHWESGEPWATEAICDGGTHWMRDPRTGKYALYGRTKFISPEVQKAWAGDAWVDKNFWGRSVARVTSPDFVHWDITDPAAAPVVMTVDTDDMPGDEIYSMNVLPYESVYIGFVQIFHNQENGGYLDIQLAVSRDGEHFTRVGDRSPFLPCGPVGSWDRFNTSLANNPPIAVGDELRFYYSGRTYRHSPYRGPDKGVPGGGIGFATVTRDRFVSLSASFEGGTVTTKPLVLKGQTLHINAKCDFGEILVEALDGDCNVIAHSAPVHGDAVDFPIEWEDGGSELFNTPVRLRFTLRNARLYAIWSP